MLCDKKYSIERNAYCIRYPQVNNISKNSMILYEQAAMQFCVRYEYAQETLAFCAKRTYLFRVIEQILYML